jgi:hypothetical protein
MSAGAAPGYAHIEEPMQAGVLEELSEAIAAAFAPVAIVIAALAATGLVFPAAMSWFESRSGSTRAREALFVGRWGVLGPELYLVGDKVRRLPGPQEHDRRASRGHPSIATLGFAREILAAVMRCRPAGQLAWAFAEAELYPLPPDGFVISRSEVEAWLETRNRGQSSQVTQ